MGLYEHVYATGYGLNYSFLAHRQAATCIPPCSWWRHQMETFSALLAICTGNSPVPDEFPTQRPVTRSFDVYLICARINGWVNNREAGDLRRYRRHYDVTVMSSPYFKAHPTMLKYCILITYRGRQLFNIFDIPAYLDISLDSIFAWDFRDKLSSKITKVFKPWNTFKLDAISLYGRYQSSYVLLTRIKNHGFGLRYIQRELV